jgi:hypothetical protein
LLENTSVEVRKSTTSQPAEKLISAHFSQDSASGHDFSRADKAN